MIFSALILIIFGVLLLASYLDIKYKAVPSVILTSMILTVLLLNPENIYFGVVAFVFAILVKDLINDVAGLDFGVADIKIMIIIGLILSSRMEFLLMIGIFAVFQLVWVLLWSWKMKKDKREMPFVPCLLAVYITMMLLRWFA